jgi:hypothetical protein
MEACWREMAKEIYAFYIMNLEEVRDDPREFERTAWQEIQKKYGINPYEKCDLSYKIYEIFLSGNVSVAVYLMTQDKDMAAAIKLLLD